jgi:collagenase-like PrtC family protease
MADVSASSLQVKRPSSSPRGDRKKLETAIAYGADAVYLGSKLFSLRAQKRKFHPG